MATLMVARQLPCVAASGDEQRAATCFALVCYLSGQRRGYKGVQTTHTTERFSS